MMYVQHDAHKQSFFIKMNNDLCELRYRKKNPTTFDYYSTFVPESLRGQGLAANITKFALQYAKDHDYFVIPSCPYVKAYIDKHPEFADVVMK